MWSTCVSLAYSACLCALCVVCLWLRVCIALRELREATVVADVAVALLLCSLRLLLL